MRLGAMGRKQQQGDAYTFHEDEGGEELAQLAKQFQGATKSKDTLRKRLKVRNAALIA